MVEETIQEQEIISLNRKDSEAFFNALDAPVRFCLRCELRSLTAIQACLQPNMAEIIRSAVKPWFFPNMSYIVFIYCLFAHIIRLIMKSHATDTLPRAARYALVKLGEDIAVARKKRRISTVSMSERAFISRGTLYKVEKGDPSVSMGIYATVLSLLGLADGLAKVADRRDDTLGLDLEEDRLPRKIVSPGRKGKQR